MAKDLSSAYVDRENAGGITTIEFFHPQSNSLPHHILDQLAREVTAAGDDNSCKVIILRSAGEKAFCAGASFEELTQIHDEHQGFEFFSGFAKVINAMRKCPKMIIGRIQGKCVGGGVGLAAAMDYAIAREGADVKLSELAVGIGPFVVGPAVERKIGASAFAQLAVNATQWQPSSWALQKGLFMEVHPTVDAMDASITALSSQLLQSSPLAMSSLKSVLWEGTSGWDDLLFQRARISGRLVLSDFTKKAIENFKSAK